MKKEALQNAIDEGNEYGLTDEERARLLEEAEAEIEKLKPDKNKIEYASVF